MNRNFQRGLLISTALPIAIVSAASAQARDVVVPAPIAPATSVPGSAVNVLIVQAITAPDDRNLKVTIPTAGVVTGNSVTLNPGVGQGDGVVELINDGKIGAVDATTSAVTDGAGVVFNGRSVSGNIFTGTNNGLIAGGVRALNFGQSVTITNAGTVHNGIVGTSQGDVAITTTASGAVRSGSINATSFSTSTTAAPVDGFATTTTTGGKASVVQAGDAADAQDDTIRGNVNASGLAGADVRVAAKARAISASAGGVVQSVNGSNAVTNGTVTTTTTRNDVTLGGGAATITIAEAGDVTSATANSVGGASVGVDGAVAGSVISVSAGASSTGSSVTVVDGGVTKSVTSKNTSTQVGKTAAVTVAETGTVGGSVTANGQSGATVAVNGAVNGNVGLTSLATNTVSDGTLTSFSNSSVAAGGAASGAVGKTGTIGGSVTASADGGVVLANAGVIKGNVSGMSRRIVSSGTGSNPTTTTSSPTLTETNTQIASTTRDATTTGTVSFANASGAQVQGSVTLNAGGDVNYTNDGAVFGSTTLTSQGTEVVTARSLATKTSTAIATPPAQNTVTTTVEDKQTGSTNRTGGNVVGTYANSNGTANFVTADGSVRQTADKSSTATVSGVVYGSVQSQAGSANFASSREDKTVTVQTGTNGTRTLTSASGSTTTTNAGGDSKVTVSGRLTEGTAGIDPNLFSYATGNSAVSLSGTVEGDVYSLASANDFSNAASRAVSQTITAGVSRTDSLTETNASDSKAVGGNATIDIAATGNVSSKTGNVDAYGRIGASITVAKGGVVGSETNLAGVYARAEGTDTLSKQERSFSRNVADGTAVASEKLAYTTLTSTGVGAASAAVAGKVAGDAEARTSRGPATTTVTGTVGGDAAAYASDGTDYQYNQTIDYAGKVAASGSTLFTSLVPAISKRVTSYTDKEVGGAASVVVNTASDLQKLDRIGVAGSVYAGGLVSAAATVSAGSKVGGDVSAFSDFADVTFNSIELFNSSGVQTDYQSTFAEVLSGGGASVNLAANSEVGGNVTADGDKTASVVNAGSVASSVTADALHSVLAQTFKSTNRNNVGLRQDETVNTFAGIGGAASVVNALGALIGGDVLVAGGTGTLVNAGGIGGDVYLGKAVQNYTLRTVDTVANRVETATVAPTPTAQSYTLDQNNFLAGGVYVGGATIANPFSEDEGDLPDLKTSNVKATINLNAGSITLGNIEGQREDETGVYLTDATLNFTGAGFLGADVLNLKTPTSPDYIPEAVLSKEAQELGYGAGTTSSVQILGVNAVNKTGTGTFVLNLAAYDQEASPADIDRWSADIGSLNVLGGELQLTGPAYDPTEVDGDYIGIKGNVNVNGGALVVGRRTRVDGGIIGGSIATGGAEKIQGVHVVINGDYTQAAGGTTVVGITPSLVRFAPITIGTVNGGSEVLGPIQAGANVPFFTTPEKGFSDQSTPSRIDVTGKVTLAGKVLVDVTRDAIYSSGDGYTLFTYGDAGSAVTGAVSQSIASPFVSFELKNDTAKKTIQIAAKRVAYSTVATNPNAVSAASALDALIPVITAKVRDDASNGSVFTTVSEIGLVQDAANIVSGLDWRLSQAGAAQVFNELSSAEIYGSLAAIEQNSALTESFESAPVTSIGTSGVGLWLNPVGRFARYGGTNSGASKIRDNSYGGAFGLNLGYADNGTIGIGFAYAEHDIDARGTPESAKAKTYSLGINWRHAFGAIHAGAQFVYGFSNFDVTRELTVLDRTTKASFKGREWNGNIEVGYNVTEGTSAIVMPYGKLALRHWTLGGFTEEGGAGVGVSAKRDSKSVFVPEVGVRLATDLVANDAVTVRPFGKLSYTFQGDVGSTRAFTFAAGGVPFDLKGVDPKGFGSVDGGVSAIFNERVGVYVQGGYNFGGTQKGAEVRGGVNVRF